MDDEALAEAKRMAIASGRLLAAVVEDAPRDELARQRVELERQRNELARKVGPRVAKHEPNPHAFRSGCRPIPDGAYALD